MNRFMPNVFKNPFINDIIRPLFKKTDVFAKEVDRFNFGGILKI